MVSNDGISYEECEKLIGTLPSVEPRPTYANLKELVDICVRVAKKLPSKQSTNMGHAGMIMKPQMYAFYEATPWVNPINPGEQPAYPRHRNTSEQDKTDAKDRWEAATRRYNTYNNFRRAMFDALDKAIPDAFKISNTLGQQGWDRNLTIREILDSVEDPWGIPTAHDVWENDRVMRMQYNPTDPIEGLLKRVEDCQMMAVAASNPYTLPQLISTVIVLVEKSGNYVKEMKEWHKKPPIEKENWFILRKFLITTYLDKVRHGLITASAQGYHGAAYNATGFSNPEPSTDDDSLASITSITEGFSAMAAARQQDSVQLSTLTATTHQLHSQLAAQAAEIESLRQLSTQQHAAYMMKTAAPAPPAYAPPPAPPAVPTSIYQPPPAPYPAPPTQPNYQPAYSNYSGGRGRGRGRRGGGRGRRGGGYSNSQSYSGGYGYNSQQNWNAPAPAPFSNPVKRHDNDLFCWSCGFDVDHESKDCPPWKRYDNHQQTATKWNYLQFPGPWSIKGQHKTIKPSDPRAQQYRPRPSM